ncbi:MAG: DoxX family protein [Paracoccus sp. (in: a-proteobacteria)]
MKQRLTAVFEALDRQAPLILPLIARLGFVAALGPFFWRSALTKLDGLSLSAGAYVQILPKLAEAHGYDPSAMPFWAHLIVWFGTLAELALPALILIGLFSHLSALAMMGFIAVMTLTDIFGHAVSPMEAIPPRLLWLAVLAVPIFLGGGALSADHALRR